MTKVLKLGVLILSISLVLVYLAASISNFGECVRAPFGSSSDDHYIVIKGFKPEDALVKAYVTFYGGGDSCEAFFVSGADGIKRDGSKAVFLSNYNFSGTKDRYELRVPYTNVTSSSCKMKLHRIIVDAENDFDSVGFAELRITQPIYDNDMVVATSSIIDAKSCNSEIWQWANKKNWSGATECLFFVDGEVKTKEPEPNAYSIHMKFQDFSDGTIINYNILAGENYRSKRLEQNVELP
ncbi:hypothetical protein ABS858_01960 [Vibrio neptunius]|uniref:hypothetical protein n=1 Tax=Vibrio neptunius TaxID=170651 RepID=UPI0033156E79